MPEIVANIQEGKYEDVLAAVQSPVIALTELVKNASDSCLSKEDPIIIRIDTQQKSITIEDLGQGLSSKELDHLGKAGYSTKMVADNTCSPIGNPLSGSKGLGLLTAFFIADTLEIKTHSVVDKKSYFLEWKKGNQKYSYDEIKSEHKGTIVTLKNIESEKLQMILLPEEKTKLFMSSLRFFTNSEKLPQIKLIIDNNEENKSHYPKETLDSFYQRNKGENNGFVAKASFRYENNKLFLSYEDNVSKLYTFAEKIIDLSNPQSVDRFVEEFKLHEKGVVPIKSICDSNVFTKQYLQINLPTFSGVMYTWRSKKSDELAQWPVGVRIYINNYSLYRYLDKENDWLNLSEVSQNIKATNYKLKNTYGYLDLTNYNENKELLKISKERNDFVDSLAQRKFIHIMRDVIVGIYTRIDIAVKNNLARSFSLSNKKFTVSIGSVLSLSKEIKCNNIGLEDLHVVIDNPMLSINKDWDVSAEQAGEYEIRISDGDTTRTCTIEFETVSPSFNLSKKTISIDKGDTISLRDYIGSCKHLDPNKIEIRPENTNTIIRNNVFTKDNNVGQHTIFYAYGDLQHLLKINVKKINYRHTADKSISSLFPQLEELGRYSIKLPELVDAISSNYEQAPTLCMAAIRILMECSARSFIYELLDDKINDNPEGFPQMISRVMNICQLHEDNKDYKKIKSHKDNIFMKAFIEISNTHKKKLSKDVRNNINTTLESFDFNMFVHNPQIISTNNTVHMSMDIFSPVLNYIFDILILISHSK